MATRSGMRLLNPASPMASLSHAPMRPGTVTWIGLRPGRRQPLLAVTQADLDPVKGLSGDHYRGDTNPLRQVTLVQAEHLVAIASFLGVGRIDPNQLRRNIVVAGINLLALRGQHFRLGRSVLLGTGACHPCSRMEEILGTGGYNAVRGHGGITARVISGGRIGLGDTLVRIDDDVSNGESPGL